jgi:hypothetical protein
MLEIYKIAKIDNLSLNLINNRELNYIPRYQRELMGSDTVFYQFFGSPDVSGKIEVFASGTQLKQLEVILNEQKNHFLVLPDWQGLVVIKSWSITKEASEVGFSSNNGLVFGSFYEIEFEKADTDNPFKTQTTDLDIAQEKAKIEVLTQAKFTRQFKNSFFNSSTFDKITGALHSVNSAFLNLSKGVNVATNSVRNVSNFLNTTLFNVDNSISSLDGFNVAVADFGAVIYKGIFQALRMW